MFDSMPSTINLVKAGKLRALAVTESHRVDVIPDVPTMTELNYPDVNLKTWYGLWGPANLPREIVDRIYADISAVLGQDDIKRRLGDVIAEPMGDSPDKFSAFCQSESERYAAIVAAAHLHPQ